MKKLLILAAAALMAMPAVLHAQKSFYVTNDGKKVQVDSISANPKSPGDFLYKKGPAQSPLKKDDVKYIWIVKPAEVQAADDKFNAKDYAGAAQGYAAAAETYKQFGWEAYSLYKQAEALKAAGKLDEALKVLEGLQGYPVANPDDNQYVASASLMLGRTYLEAKQFDKALSFVASKSNQADDNAAFAAYMLRGDIYCAMAAENPADRKALTKKAAMAYFSAALLFEKAGDRPQALYRSYELLLSMNDARAAEFAKILREKYPDNAYTKQLK